MVTRTRAALALGCLVLALGAGIGCEAIVGIKDRSVAEADSGASDATMDVAPSVDSGGGDSADMCTHTFPPARPTTDDGQLDLQLELAMRTVDFGIRLDGGAPPPLGFDLDGVCTCPGPESCAPIMATDKHCDTAGGRDNSLGSLFATFANVSQGAFNQESYNQRISDGVWSLVLRVSHYNGGANDTAVGVGVFLSDGPTPPPPDGGVDAGDGGTDAGIMRLLPPQWDGNDFWLLDDKSVLGGNGSTATPIYFDTMAYVTNHVLVAHVDFPMRIVGGVGIGAIRIDLVGGLIAGTLVPERGTFRLDDGTIAGRWATKNFALALNAFPEPPPATGYICPGSPSFIQVHPIICSAADIFADPRERDAAATCDGLSVGFGFTAYPGHLGPAFHRPPDQSNCPDAGNVDCTQ